MLKQTSIAFMFLASALASGVGLCGDETEHHGSMVNGDGTYLECLACHDGVTAKVMAPCITEICVMKTDHPVNRPYPPPSKLHQYTPAAVAEMAGVKLVNGRIDCISCHNLGNPGRFHLRIEDIRSRLCLACHLK